MVTINTNIRERRRMLANVLTAMPNYRMKQDILAPHSVQLMPEAD
jgi:hypothetical protein